MTDTLIEESIRVPPGRNANRSTQTERSRKNRYGRIPDEVLTDHAICHAAARLYGIMAMYVYEGNVVTLGIRKMSGMMNCGLASIHRYLKSLIEAGYVAKAPAANGKRSIYELTSPVFAQKQGETTVVRSGPRGKRMVSVGPEDVRSAASA